MTIRLGLAIWIMLLLTGCMKSSADFFAASEKLEMPVVGAWSKISGGVSNLPSQIMIERNEGKSYLVREGESQRAAYGLSFVGLKDTDHFIAIGSRAPGGFNWQPGTFYYLVRLEGEDVFIMEMGCPVGRIEGLTKNRYECIVHSRAALMAAAYDHLANRVNLGPTAAGARYRRTPL